MEVLKKGIKDIKYVKKCKRCKCKFTYTLDDTTSNIKDEYILYCPDCDEGQIVYFMKKYKGKGDK